MSAPSTYLQERNKKYINDIKRIRKRYKYTSMELEAQRKDEERQEEEEVTEELKRFTMQEMARGFSLFEETLFVSF